MPEVVTKFINKYKEKWNTLEKSQKIRLIASVVIVLGSVIVAVFLVTRPNYEKIITGEPTAIGEMSTVLTGMSIGHKIGDNNTAILVKAKDKDSAQIALVQSGHLDDSTKFEDSLNLITFSRTESDKQKIYKEYYESKIATKLKKMDTIKEATVSLSIPEKSVFIGDNADDEPTASVMITPNVQLTKTQLEGIETLVASSVERLDAENVTVVDNTGAILNNFEDTNLMTGLSSTNLQLQDKKKNEIETQITQLLGDLADNVKVMANIVCDFDQETTSSVEYQSPIEGSEAGIIVSQELSKESLENTDAATLTGTDANQGIGATLTSTGEGSSYKSDKSTTNYEVNQTNKEHIKALGNIDPQRSSISVNFLYGKKVEISPVETEEQINTVIKMVSNATGINAERISISAFKTLVSEEKAGITTFTSVLIILENVAPYLTAIIIILVAVVFVLKLMRYKNNEEEDLLPYGAGIGTNVDYTVGGEDDSIKELDNNSEIKQQIGAFIDKQPDIAAGMLRNWLYENDKSQ